MTQLSDDQIAGYAVAAGFRGVQVAWVVAICIAESGGDTASIGAGSYGLMQIQQKAGRNLTGWQDPTWQMQTAWAMSEHGTNFQQWCTAVSPPMPVTLNGVSYPTGCKGKGSGNARQFLARGAAAAQEPTNAVAGATGGIVVGGAVQGEKGTLRGIAKFLPNLAVLPKINRSRTASAAIDGTEWRWPHNAAGGKLINFITSESTVDLTVGSVPQIQLTVADPDFLIANSLLPSIKQKEGHEGPLALYQSDVFIVAEIQTTEVNTVPATIITLSSAVFAWMQTQRTQSGVGESATQWIAAAISLYNSTLPSDKPRATFTGQPTQSRANDINLTPDVVQWTSFYDYATTLAEQEGYWLFESAGGVYFGEPPWLYNHLTSTVNIGWPGLTNTPSYNRSDVDVECIAPPVGLRSQSLFTGDTMTLQLPRGVGEQMRQGMRVKLHGMGVWDKTQWLVQTVTFALDGGGSPVQVGLNEAKRIVPPQPGGIQPASPTSDPTDPGSGAPVATVGSTASTRAFVGYAESQTGDAYVWGGENPGTHGSGGFDCSGIVQWSAIQCGVQGLPRVAADQYAWCASHGGAISPAQAMVTYGALLFVTDSTAAAIHHVAISLGDGAHIFQAEMTGTNLGIFPATAADFQYGAEIPGLNYSGANANSTSSLGFVPVAGG